ncbi:MAG: dihydrofolate reductase FolA [Candidatus Parcubacteria bacterium]|jgi:dihydrofolate reductase
MISAFIIAASSVDGFIGRKKDEPSFAWTTGADKKFFIERTKQAKVVVMGSKTFETIGKPLKDRLIVVYSRHKKYDQPGIETTALPPKELLESLEKRGYGEVAICGGSSIYSLFLEAKVVSKIYLTLEPRLFGAGISLLEKPTDTTLSLVSSTALGHNALLLEYSVIH